MPVAELYRRYAGRLYGFGRAKLGDAGLAEELVQECFVRLWRTAGRFDPDRASVRTYLFTIAGSVSIDLYRRRAAHPFEPLPERDLPTGGDDMNQLVDSLTVRDALDSLSPAHREVLTLAHDHGLTQPEMASRLGVPLGTVKTRTFHGLRAFRTALQERGFDV